MNYNRKLSREARWLDHIGMKLRMQTQAQDELGVRLPKLLSYEAYYLMVYKRRTPLWEFIIAKKGPTGDVAWVEREATERAYTSEERFVIASEAEFLQRANEYVEVILRKLGVTKDEAQGFNERLLSEKSFEGWRRHDFVQAIAEANQHAAG